MTPETIAAVCHEANRRYCKEIGDNSQRPWEEAPFWQKQSAIAGVAFLLEHPDSPPSRMHEIWMERKLSEGWKYGPEKNEDTKEHPCIRPYAELPEQQQIKDRLFRSIVLALTQGENHA